MKCPTCESCEYEQYCGATEIMRKCERHNKKVDMTNEEWFASLSTEEKAKVLNDLYWGFGYKAKLYYNLEPAKESFEKWLRQSHKEN